MTRKELTDFFYDVQDAAAERRALGEFDANSRYIILLLEGMEALIAHSLDQLPKDAK